MADAGAINNIILPFDCYKLFVLTGAEQNNLPADSTKTLKNTAAKADMNAQRSMKQQTILNGIEKP